jgi:hypothetical protein
MSHPEMNAIYLCDSLGIKAAQGFAAPSESSLFTFVRASSRSQRKSALKKNAFDAMAFQSRASEAASFLLLTLESPTP